MNKKSINKIIKIIKVIKKQKNKNNLVLPFAVVFSAMFLIFFSFQTNSFANTVFASNNSKHINSKHIKKLFVDPTTMNVSFDFQNASLVDVIRMIAKVSNMNVLIGSNVKGTVTMKMHNVPLKDIFSVILDAYGLGIVKKDGIYYINSSSSIASVISAQKKAKAISGPKITKIIPVNYVSVAGLTSKVKTVLSSEGTVMVDKSMHALIVTDIRKNVIKAENLVKELDRRTPEVEIIAKMVEVSRNYTNKLGINWEGGSSLTSPTASNPAISSNYSSGNIAGVSSGPGLYYPSTTGIPLDAYGAAVNGSSAAGTFSIGIVSQYASISATIEALESLSKAKSIASPKVVVLNNQTATIAKGETLYLPGIAGVGAVAAPQAITAQISLNITPHIMANGDVKLTINSTNDTVAPPVSGAQATLDTESANSTVIVHDGNTAVLGGVYQTSKVVTNGGIPGLMNIPLLGWLFKSQTIIYSKDELLIFITPKIIKG
ncbi:MAG: secretin N-terminal domain-containing protein [bacterium]